MIYEPGVTIIIQFKLNLLTISQLNVRNSKKIKTYVKL